VNRSYGFFSVRGLAVFSSALALLIFTAFPLAWMASTALKVSQEIFVTPPT
jgi:ABC-type glycerol-3-phosphate transport system permease component